MTSLRLVVAETVPDVNADLSVPLDDAVPRQLRTPHWGEVTDLYEVRRIAARIEWGRLRWWERLGRRAPEGWGRT